MTRDADEAYTEWHLIAASSKSLRGLAGQLREIHGVPLQEDGDGLRAALCRQVAAIAREEALCAFKEGYADGCRAGIEAARPERWESIQVPRSRMVCSAGNVGEVTVGPFTVPGSKD